MRRLAVLFAASWAASWALAPCVCGDSTAPDRMIRVGSHRLQVHEEGKGSPAVVIDAGHLIHDSIAQDIELTIDPEARTVSGRHHSPGGLSRDFDLYWIIAFDRPLAAYGGWRGSEVLDGVTSISSPTAGGGVYLEFDVPDGGVLNLRVGLSVVDLDGARNNLAAEAPDFSFDAVRAQHRSTLGSAARPRPDRGNRSEPLEDVLHLGIPRPAR